MMNPTLRMLGAGSLAMVLVVGCATDGTMSDSGRGATIGGLTGAAGGAIIGSLSGNAGKGALIGAIGGALAGGAAGAYMQRQRQDFEQSFANEIASGVIRVQPLPNDQLLVGMTGATTFETGSDRIKPAFYSTLDEIARIVNQYGKTRLVIAGHTDSVGSAQFNQLLSEQRADSVASYLRNDGVTPVRMTTDGYGKTQPIASNDTEQGRRLNRRVDIILVPIVES